MAKRRTLKGRGQGPSKVEPAPAPKTQPIETAEELIDATDRAEWTPIEKLMAERVMEVAKNKDDKVTAVTSGNTLTIRIGNKEFTSTESLENFAEPDEEEEEEPSEAGRRRSRVKKQTRRTQRNRRNRKGKQLRKLTTRRR